MASMLRFSRVARPEAPLPRRGLGVSGGSRLPAMEDQEKKDQEKKADPPEHLSESELEEGGHSLDEGKLEGEGPPPK